MTVTITVITVNDIDIILVLLLCLLSRSTQSSVGVASANVLSTLIRVEVTPMMSLEIGCQDGSHRSSWLLLLLLSEVVHTAASVVVPIPKNWGVFMGQRKH